MGSSARSRRTRADLSERCLCPSGHADQSDPVSHAADRQQPNGPATRGRERVLARGALSAPAPAPTCSPIPSRAAWYLQTSPPLASVWHTPPAVFCQPIGPTPRTRARDSPPPRPHSPMLGTGTPARSPLGQTRTAPASGSTDQSATIAQLVCRLEAGRSRDFRGAGDNANRGLGRDGLMPSRSAHDRPVMYTRPAADGRAM